jgi:Ser/Thr protein kinase RdoA (MazF antagonist)
MEGLSHFAGILGLPVVSFRFLRRSQNTVYAFEDSEGKARILRITPGNHRSLPELHDELDLVRHLHDSGLRVCPPIPFSDGSLVSTTTLGPESFHGVIFEKAQGRPLESRDPGPKLYRLHGRQLGLLHVAAKRDSSPQLSQRKRWHDERYFTTDLHLYLPEAHRPALRKLAQSLSSQIENESRAEQYGPVHLDLGYSNFHLNDDSLDLFDFDNCARAPFALDAAAALYGSLFTLLHCAFPGDRSAFESPKTGQNLERMWGPFAEGYQSANTGWEEITKLLKICMELMYFRSVVHACRLQYGSTNPKVRGLLDADIRNLLNRTPPLNFDFKTGKAV